MHIILITIVLVTNLFSIKINNDLSANLFLGIDNIDYTNDNVKGFFSSDLIMITTGVKVRYKKLDFIIDSSNDFGGDFSYDGNSNDYIIDEGDGKNNFNAFESNIYTAQYGQFGFGYSKLKKSLVADNIGKYTYILDVKDSKTNQAIKTYTEKINPFYIDGLPDSVQNLHPNNNPTIIENKKIHFNSFNEKKFIRYNLHENLKWYDFFGIVYENEISNDAIISDNKKDIIIHPHTDSSIWSFGIYKDASQLKKRFNIKILTYGIVNSTHSYYDYNLKEKVKLSSKGDAIHLELVVNFSKKLQMYASWEMYKYDTDIYKYDLNVIKLYMLF